MVAGLVNDPAIDGSYQINKGFRQARQLLLDVDAELVEVVVVIAAAARVSTAVAVACLLQQSDSQSPLP